MQLGQLFFAGALLAAEDDARPEHQLGDRLPTPIVGQQALRLIDVRLDDATALEEASSELADAYAQQADWDPRSTGGAFVVLLLRPHRIQAWREADEIEGRTLMREGRWLV